MIIQGSWAFQHLEQRASCFFWDKDLRCLGSNTLYIQNWNSTSQMTQASRLELVGLDEDPCAQYGVVALGADLGPLDPF